MTVVVELRPEVSTDHHPAVLRRVETEIVSRCELRPVVQALPYGTLPKTEFKAKRVKDER